MLRQSQMTLFIAVRTRDLQPVLDIISEACPGESVIHQGYGLSEDLQTSGENGSDFNDSDPEPHPANEGRKLGRSGAVVFIWTLDQYELP